MKNLPYYWTIDEGISRLKERCKQPENHSIAHHGSRKDDCSVCGKRNASPNEKCPKATRVKQRTVRDKIAGGRILLRLLKSNIPLKDRRSVVAFINSM